MTSNASQEFCDRAVGLVESCKGLVTVVSHRKKGESRLLCDEDRARLVLAKMTVRLGFLGFLQVRGWLTFGDRDDYLFALYDDWVSQPGAYRFQQLLSMLFTNGLAQPSRNARRLVERRIGSVPYLGPPLLHSEDFERDFATDDGLLVLPNEFWSGLIGDGGLFRNGGAVSLFPGEGLLDPDCIGRFAYAIQGRGAFEEYESAAVARVQSNLEMSESKIALLSPDEALARLSAIKTVDPACGPGSVLVQTVRQIMERMEGLAADHAVTFNKSLFVRRLIEKGLHGMDDDEFFVEVTRLRLALEIIRHDDYATPLLDLKRDIEVGEGISIVTPFSPGSPQMAEGSRMEFKSTLEWDSLRKKRSPDLLLGCLKSICGFLNGEGGVLMIGVGDDGIPKGLNDDFALIKDPAKEDTFENRLREFLKNHIEPIPLHSVEVTFPLVGGVKVCQIDVRPRPTDVTYLVYKDPKTGQPTEDIYVRDGNRTIALRGRKRDQFILSRLRR